MSSLCFPSFYFLGCHQEVNVSPPWKRTFPHSHFSSSLTTLCFDFSRLKDSNLCYNQFQDTQGFPGGSDSKKSAINARDLGSIPGLGRSPGEGNSNLLQHSCLENPHGQRGLPDHRPWGHKELDTTQRLTTSTHTHTHTHTQDTVLFHFSYILST